MQNEHLENIIIYNHNTIYGVKYFSLNAELSGKAQKPHDEKNMLQKYCWENFLGWWKMLSIQMCLWFYWLEWFLNSHFTRPEMSFLSKYLIENTFMVLILEESFAYFY